MKFSLLSFRLFQLCNVIYTFTIIEVYVFRPGIPILGMHTIALAALIFLTVNVLKLRNWTDSSYILAVACFMFWTPVMSERFLLYLKYRAMEILRWVPSTDIVGDATFKTSFELLDDGLYRLKVLASSSLEGPVADHVSIMSKAEVHRIYWKLVDASYTGTRYKAPGATLLRILASPFNLGQALQRHLLNPLLWRMIGDKAMANTPMLVMISVPIAWFILARQQFNQAPRAN
ncbi:hypothetical protein BCR37DRAFT_128234 [Protomyces lactucae-debilis]|uniref:Uncharacterized protein n=1 Tax=Protomyces lactucae-debilis TaxID=2754530 RepID=A0A1Y2FTG6_PROLT|nr:uncharacterized protein BCR37DRAFT_128234 [Protomyces lactucae-debilis]ORY86877.1 hypothetical protein BCR37DRAFT_128234 [Protomyces lactucae-debilis]